VRKGSQEGSLLLFGEGRAYLLRWSGEPTGNVVERYTGVGAEGKLGGDEVPQRSRLPLLSGATSTSRQRKPVHNCPALMKKYVVD
jgi:hypothetical protein